LSPFLAGVTWLLLFQCAGEALAQLTGMPVPGPVLGMILLFVALMVRPSFALLLATAADGLARHLSLLFVPAGVGVMLHLHRVANEWLPIAVALVVSTVLALAATAWTFQYLARRAEPTDSERTT
jgi:holin-like protein